MAGFRGFVVSLAVVFAVAYWLDSEPPPGFSSPWKYKVFGAVAKLVKSATKLAVMLGFAESDLLLLNKIQRPSPIPANYTEVQTQDAVFDGVTVRIYTHSDTDTDPQSDLTPSPQPALLYFHGGGHCIGSIDMFDVVTRRLAQNTRAVVVSVEYSLAPHSRFPTAVQECGRVYKYLVNNAALYNVDPARIGLAGDSAGGNLAAATALLLRDEGVQPQPKYHVLIYPSLQSLDMLTPSYQQNRGNSILSQKIGAKFKSMYLLGEVDAHLMDFMTNNHVIKSVKEKYAASYLNHELIPEEYIFEGYVPVEITEGDGKLWDRIKDICLSPYSSPLLAEDLEMLPPTHVITCESDMLRDDGIWYVGRLRKAGNDVSHTHFKSAFHTVLNLWPFFDEGDEMMADVENFIIKKQ